MKAGAKKTKKKEKDSKIRGHTLYTYTQPGNKGTRTPVCPNGPGEGMAVTGMSKTIFGEDPATREGKKIGAGSGGGEVDF